MDKTTKKQIIWSLDLVLKYIKTCGEENIFDPSHCLAHLQDAIDLLKQQETLKQQKIN
jgi:hypothetical protein